MDSQSLRATYPIVFYLRDLPTTDHKPNPACKNILSIMKKWYLYKNLFVWKNATYPQTITLFKMSDPQNVALQLMWPLDKKCIDHCTAVARKS